MKFIRIFLLVLIIVGVGLLATQKMWVPKVVEMILKNENKQQTLPISDDKSGSANSRTYVDTKNGFEFAYPNEERVTSSAMSKDDLGKKIIYVEIINSKDGFTCVAGEDVRCKNIVVGNHNIVVQYSMSGNINASAEIQNSKSVLLSLSCDSIGSGMTLQNDYCIISEQRQKMFDNLLSTFKYTK